MIRGLTVPTASSGGSCYQALPAPPMCIKLIGLRFAGAELLPSARFGLRLVMANEATVTQQEARELLAPHSELLLNLFIHIGGGAGGQQKTDT